MHVLPHPPAPASWSYCGRREGPGPAAAPPGDSVLPPPGLGRRKEIRRKAKKRGLKGEKRGFRARGSFSSLLCWGAAQTSTDGSATRGFGVGAGAHGAGSLAVMRLEAAEKLWALASKTSPEAAFKAPGWGEPGAACPTGCPRVEGTRTRGGGIPFVRGSVLLLLLFYNFFFFLFLFIFFFRGKRNQTHRARNGERCLAPPGN